MNMNWRLVCSILFIMLPCATPLEAQNFTSKSYHWSSWSRMPLGCSVTCGVGIRCRVRKCLDDLGNEAPHTRLCHNPEDYIARGESCTLCTANAACPTVPGWSRWSAWTKCTPREEIDRTRKKIGRCQLGLRTRNRTCNNPSPAASPNYIPCAGKSQQISVCPIKCDDRPWRRQWDVNLRITLQIEKDFRYNSEKSPRVLRRPEGARVQLSCNTSSYRLAKGLIARAEFAGLEKGLIGQDVRITWYKNGESITHLNQLTGRQFWANKSELERRVTNDPLMAEFRRWESLLDKSIPKLKKTELIFENLRSGDRGFYACEMSLGQKRWIVTFYSIIITTNSIYKAHATDPFYLHSNIGLTYAFRRTPPWMEAAQLVWKHNGLEYSRGLALSQRRRIQLIDELNVTHTGTWTCYLILPPPTKASRTATPWIRVDRVYLLSEFYLHVKRGRKMLWEMADNPVSLRTLRNVVTTLIMIIETLVLLILLNIWAARRWFTRTLNSTQQRVIVNETLDNHCRLMLTARRRAAVNRERLIPLIVSDQKRLNQMVSKLTDRYVEPQEDEEEEGDNLRRSRPSKLWERTRQGFNRFSNLFKRTGTLSMVAGLPQIRFSTESSDSSGASWLDKRVFAQHKTSGTSETLKGKVIPSIVMSPVISRSSQSSSRISDRPRRSAASRGHVRRKSDANLR